MLRHWGAYGVDLPLRTVATSRTRPDGSFSFTEVPSGTWVMQISSRTVACSSLAVEVEEEDLTGIVFRPSRSGRWRGRILAPDNLDLTKCCLRVAGRRGNDARWGSGEDEDEAPATSGIRPRSHLRFLRSRPIGTVADFRLSVPASTRDSSCPMDRVLRLGGRDRGGRTRWRKQSTSREATTPPTSSRRDERTNESTPLTVRGHTGLVQRPRSSSILATASSLPT
jgi:hypothetical protein